MDTKKIFAVKSSKISYPPYQKTIRFLTWGIGILLFLITLGLVILNLLLPPFIRLKINQHIITGSDSLYHCSVSSISTNIWNGSVVLKGVSIQIDSTKYKSLQLAGQLPTFTIGLDMVKGSISGVKILPLIFSNTLIVEKITIERGRLLLSQHKKLKKTNASVEANAWKDLSAHLNGVYINQIILQETSILYYHSENKTTHAISFNHCFVQLDHIRIDSIGASSSHRTLFTEAAIIQLAEVNYLSSDSLYLVRMDSFNYSSTSKNIHIRNLQIRPTIHLTEFTKKKGRQTDVFEAVMPSVHILNFNIRQMVAGKLWSADTITIEKPLVNIKRDRTARSDTTSQYGKYPNEMLKNSHMPIRIDWVLIKMAEIHYIEKQKLSNKIGDIFFTQVSGSISNITNIASGLNKNPICEFNLNGYFLQHGKLHVNLRFDLLSPNESYHSTAHLGAVSLAELNSVFIPFASVRLKSMHMYTSDMELFGNKNGITGTSKLIYDKLSIEMLHTNTKTHTTKKQGFVSLLANVFVIRAHNKTGKNEITAHNLYVTRKKQQPFANLIWEFLFECMKKLVLKTPMSNLKVEI
jgi:hypothetical protein